MSTQPYDIIGDVHGHATKLTALLGRLGYREMGGLFQHPERRAIFVGDLIDRGPAVRETVQTVRAMVDGGSALAVLGNHELLALEHAHGTQWPGGLAPARRVFLETALRRTLADFAGHPEEWAAAIGWFARLPLFLDLGGLRIVHAAWSDAAIATLGGRDTVASFLPTALTSGTPEHQAVNLLVNGWQIALPGSPTGTDHATAMRTRLRLAWWKQAASPTYQSLSFPFDLNAPETILPAEVARTLPGYPAEAPPVFFGHYALSPDSRPWPQARNVACLDYRAAKGGPLVAYRWDGEGTLDPAKFVV